MANNEEASPICRGKNLTWETVLLFFNNMPKVAMPKAEFHSYVESRINGWTQTHSQIARQLAFYYEKDGICYPRFADKVTYIELFDYMQNWASKYFVPNPYSPSLRGKEPVCIYKYLKESINRGECDFDKALDSIFDVKLSSHDKVNVYLSNFTDILIDNKHMMSINESLSFNEFASNIFSNNVLDNKSYFDYFTINENALKESSPKIKVKKKLQQIYYGAPGTGKSHIINEQVCNESVIRTTFHPDSDYSTFVGCYKPTTKVVKMRDLAGHVIKENGVELTEDRIVYEFVEQAFLQAYIQAWKFYDKSSEEVKKQFLVIEEINRGNCAQIFGDLFQLLDRNMWGFSDYPIQADNDMRKQLAKAFSGLEISQENKDRINACYKCDKDYVQQVLNGEILLLPDNLYIWATMNTSDQSLFPIDSAFKRRWDWQYMPIAKGRNEQGKELNWSIEAEDNRYDWWSFLTKINEQIGSTTNSEDKKLGFFFCKAVNGKISAETFVGKVIFYLWNDVFKDFGFDNTIFNDEDGRTLSFDKFYATENGKVIVCKDKVELFLKNLGVDAVEEEMEADDEDDSDTEYEDAKSDLYVKFPDGAVVVGKTRFESYYNALQRIGLERIKPILTQLKYKRLNCPVISIEKYEAIENNSQGYSYVEADGCYVIKGMNGKTMRKVLLKISDILGLKLEVDYQ